MSKVKKVGGGGELNATFNNDRLLLMNLSYATRAVWSVYDTMSIMIVKNRLILTGEERETMNNVDNALLDCYIKLSGLMDARLERGAK